MQSIKAKTFPRFWGGAAGATFGWAIFFKDVIVWLIPMAVLIAIFYLTKFPLTTSITLSIYVGSILAVVLVWGDGKEEYMITPKWFFLTAVIGAVLCWFVYSREGLSLNVWGLAVWTLAFEASFYGIRERQKTRQAERELVIN